MLDKIIPHINKLLESGGRVLVAIDGDAAAGKSTLGAALAAFYNCNLLHMDDFFLPPPLRSPERLAEAGGNVHYERFKAEALEPLKKGEPFAFKPFDCKIMEFAADELHISPTPLTIVEGAYALHPTLAHAYDLKIFMQIDEKTQMERVRARNGEQMSEKFKNIWIPMEKHYHEAFDVKNSCDVVL